MIVRFGRFEVDSERRLLLNNGEAVRLKPKVFDLLALLVAEAPRVVGKEELHHRLWPERFVSEATLAGLVKEARRALRGDDDKAPLIRTTHGVGYAFAGELQHTGSRRSRLVQWVVADSRRIALADGQNFIGRDLASTVALDALGVSRRHARVLVSTTGAVLQDLESKNGTMVNGIPVTGPLHLKDGDRIQVGPIEVVYRASESGMSTETVTFTHPPVSRGRNARGEPISTSVRAGSD